jgi:hypothetical protein
MAASTTNTLGEMVEAQGPCTAPLDAAVEYIRLRFDRILPVYVLAMAPHAVVTVLLIDAIIAERRSVVAQYCGYLVLVTVWRWVWLARLQYGVDEDLQERRRTPFWSRIMPILLIRLWSNFALTWGSLLAGVPAFYGLFAGSFAAPLMLNNSESVFPQLQLALSWIQHSGRRLLRVVLAMFAIAILLIVAAFVSQAILSDTILPSLLGVDTAELGVTLNSWAWRLRVIYFLFLLLDVFWTVSSVILFYDSQSRRLATDLRARLLNIAEGLG